MSHLGVSSKLNYINQYFNKDFRQDHFYESDRLNDYSATETYHEIAL